MPDVTRLLEAAEAGDRLAAAQLLPLVCYELSSLAAARMTAEAPGHTLDATALVHEAHLRLRPNRCPGSGPRPCIPRISCPSGSQEYHVRVIGVAYERLQQSLVQYGTTPSA
jgi:ECF sigma factor